MQKLPIKIFLIVAFIFIGNILPVSAQTYETVSFGWTGGANAVASTTKNYNLYCPVGYEITQLDLLQDGGTGGPFYFTVYLDGQFIGTSSAVDTADDYSWANRSTIAISNVPCSETFLPLNIYHTNTNSRAGETRNTSGAMTYGSARILNTDGDTSHLAGVLTLRKEVVEGGTSTTTISVDMASTTQAIEDLNDLFKAWFLIGLWFVFFGFVYFIISRFTKKV